MTQAAGIGDDGQVGLGAERADAAVFQDGGELAARGQRQMHTWPFPFENPEGFLCRNEMREQRFGSVFSGPPRCRNPFPHSTQSA